MHYKNLKRKVEHCLQKFPESRNSDKMLTNAIWITFYPKYLIDNGNGIYSIKLLNLFKVPSADDVKRIRAKIQNEEKRLVPTNLRIVIKRKWKEEDWRLFLGYNPELRTIAPHEIY